MVDSNLEGIVSELQSRIGNIVSNYELQMASLKTQANLVIDSLNKEIENLKSKISE